MIFMQKEKSNYNILRHNYENYEKEFQLFVNSDISQLTLSIWTFYPHHNEIILCHNYDIRNHDVFSYVVEMGFHNGKSWKTRRLGDVSLKGTSMQTW